MRSSVVLISSCSVPDSPSPVRGTSPTALENETGQWFSLARAHVFAPSFLGKICGVARISDGRGGDGLIVWGNRKLAASSFNLESGHLMHYESRPGCLKYEIGDRLTNVVKCVPVELSRRFKSQSRDGQQEHRGVLRRNWGEKSPAANILVADYLRVAAKSARSLPALPKNPKTRRCTRTKS
jgi:hypothetical protein